MKAGSYRADLLVPGDEIDTGAIVIDVVGRGDEVVITTDRGELVVPRDKPFDVNGFRGGRE